MDKKTLVEKALKSRKPSAGMSKKKKSTIAKESKSGHDFGKKNNGKTAGFGVVADKAAKDYGSKEAGNRVAGAIFYKMMKGKKE